MIVALVALSVIATVESVALTALAWRALSGGLGQSQGPDSVTGEMLQQDPEEEWPDEYRRVGFRGPR